MSVQNLSPNECKEYVRHIKDLEVSCYQQERLIKELKLERPRKIRQQISVLDRRIQEKAPTKPEHPIMAVIGVVIADCLMSILGAFFGAGFGVLLRIILAVFSSKVKFFASPWLPYITIGAIIGFIIMFLLCLLGQGGTKQEAIKARQLYPQQVASFEKQREEDKKIIDIRRHELSIILPQKIRESENIYSRTKEVLNQYYRMGIIYPKYRGLVPICTIYEYLESGRCTSLTGYEGAYNMYEQELRMNAIIGKLDDIIYQLDEIGESQRLLAQEIRQSNARLDQVITSLDRIDNNTSLTQYYSRITASNTSALTWLTAWGVDNQRKIINQIS